MGGTRQIRKDLTRMRELNGRVACITGGGSGIGLGIAMASVNSGMKVVLANLRRDHLENALAHFGNQGQERSVHAIELDVTDRRAYEVAASEAERVFGKTHLLCNNAGIGIAGPFKQCTCSDGHWRKQQASPGKIQEGQRAARI
jgi:NADP-dependent 3-hydroxy acid dehydrogenase YdfG